MSQYKSFNETPSWPSNPDWDPQFTPSFLPEEMLEMGVFESKYINIDSIRHNAPKSWYKYKAVSKPEDSPDPTLNYYGVKSRQPLSVWKENGWLTTHSKFGWFEWFCLYRLGRRLEKEDDWQIKRWQSFVARHQGQLDASGDKHNRDKRLKQKQALLQFAWDPRKSFTDENKKKNMKRLSKFDKVSLESVNEKYNVATTNYFFS